ncbi:hypothetical protein N9D23_06685 [Rubripirellula sp.]|jgi:hypothetical protein|nr:hypothetical protein [Planctomycetaceae bacterium]MDA9857788.1 hypothetical protein [Rubripirellula sp.]MDF1840010.1 hypothetical protein [Rubripirellula sp.]
MLTETNELELQSENDPVTGMHCIEQLQDELEQFILSTMSRLDEVAFALREHERVQRAEQEKIAMEHDSQDWDPILPLESEELTSPPENDNSRVADRLDADQTERPQEEPLNQDEPLNRLNAIKLRLANQLKKT